MLLAISLALTLAARLCLLTCQQVLQVPETASPLDSSLLAVYTPRNYSTHEGWGNNRLFPGRGGINADYSRLLPFRTWPQTNPSSIHDMSVAIFQGGPAVTPTQSIAPSASVNAMFIFFGQFLAHDISNYPRTGEIVSVPLFTPAQLALRLRGIRVNAATNLDYRKGTPRAVVGGVPFVPNLSSSYLDLNTIYGTNAGTNRQLREFVGGRLKLINGYLKTFTITTRETVLFQAYYGASRSVSVLVIFTFWLSGDPRASDNLALQSFHHLWTYEHNRRANDLAARCKCWNDEKLYFEARRWTIAIYQNIVFNKWLPRLLGETLPPFKAYDPTIDASADVFFAAAAMRFGHGMIPEIFYRLMYLPMPYVQQIAFIESNQQVTALLRQANGVASMLMGLLITSNPANAGKLSALMRDSGSSAQRFDVMTFNILRGRELGLQTFNEYRKQFGLPVYTTFSQLTSDARLQQILTTRYQKVDNMDAIVGGILEKRAAGTILGPTFRAAIIDQFRRLRDGDRYYFESLDAGFTCGEIAQIKKTTLSWILRKNLPTKCVPPAVFHGVYAARALGQTAGSAFCVPSEDFEIVPEVRCC